MLASPLLPSPRFAEESSYRPAKDLDAFNKLLPPPIEFVEGSSSGVLAVGEGKYQPINESPKKTVADSHEFKKVQQTASTKATKPTSESPNHHKFIYTGPIETSWPNVSKPVGCGLGNTGNTCFLNSALQCLLHTPPLLHILSKHPESCHSPKSNNASCMICVLRQVMQDVFTKPHSTIPYPVITKLHVIAKHMRRGRQEDSHEFLRYFVDALQRSALAGAPPKVDPKLAEKTWVYKIFGGLLRSRVSCLSCGYNSDTFDRMLDLSVDIAGVASLRDALRKFVAVDHLRGADKYKCEKCKKPVNADKQFTIHEAPAVLTVHLKRFSPMGRKIAIPIRYDERLSLEPFMSEGSFGPNYTLYGVISHAGNGPNSGHYYAHVKGANGRWHEMNDDYVAPLSGVPTSLKNAYILFYILEKGQALEAALAPRAVTPSRPTPPTSKIAGMKKRKVPDSETEDGRSSSAKTPKFIGPLLPSEQTASPMKDAGKADPQAETLKKKIAAAQCQSGKGALQSLAAYGDEDEDDDVGEKVSQEDDSAESPTAKAPSAPPASITATAPVQPRTEPAESPTSPAAGGIPPDSFYGTSTPKTTDRKRKTPDGEEDDASYKAWARTPITPSSSHKGRRHSSTPRISATNPYTQLKGGNNLHATRGSQLSSPGPDRRKPRHGPKQRLIM
ncbi:cysteine proteinase [Dichomitus squalens]|uniref:Ubiquitin carboxyl-terminal hydrolase n=1 Tax=Dichomitus squalens TaxID=114155 RepID=A0A4Q9Q6Y3_9APHY|nr:cysteine proteinase [Dichomitus squalens]TBU47207.1 cysteine proteinase [Dichomitus squalens]TBU63139.1 cysteine proteinase [Dichomitus squalens]